MTNAGSIVVKASEVGRVTLNRQFQAEFVMRRENAGDIAPAR
jgi:hypothetical protein